MKIVTKLIGCLCLLALAVTPRAAIRQSSASEDPAAPAGPRPPKMASGTFEARSAASGLAAEIRALARRPGGPAWAGYAMQIIEERHRMCCFDSLDRIHGSRSCCGCHLEKNDSFNISLGDNEDEIRMESSGNFYVLFRFDASGLNKIRTFSEECALDVGERPFYWLTDVTARDSLEWLAAWAAGRGEHDRVDEQVAEQAIAAIALHKDPGADRLLEKLISPGEPKRVREHAIFWMGVARGRHGYEVLRRLLRQDPSTEIRKKAIFALTQSEHPEAIQPVIDAAHHDESVQVRGEALFWLAQKAGSKAAGIITDAIENDPETEVKKKAVFALSQLPSKEGVPLLIEIARKNRNPAVRKEAIFWLGQSDDSRALAFIESILNG